MVQWNEDLGDWINNTEAFMQCQEYEDNPDMDERKCAAWHQVYGMYMGDGTSKTVTLTVTQVTSEIIKGPAVGNFLLGKSAFTHDYNIATQVSLTVGVDGLGRLRCIVASHTCESSHGANRWI